MAKLFSSTGSSACPCIDTASILASSVRAKCVVDSGATTTLVTTPTMMTMNATREQFNGVYVRDAHGYRCYPLSYGSGGCNRHDLFSHPACADADADIKKKKKKKEPFCEESWCYVDFDKCKDSSELVFKSTFMAHRLENDLFYSYSTCNSTNYWDLFLSTQELKDETLTVTIPSLLHPLHYKTKTADDSNNETISLDSIIGNEDDDQAARASYFKNDTIEWKGYVIDYLNAVLELTDMKGFHFTHRSGGSEVAIKSSIFTGAVYDVQAGLSDLAASLFWITSDRLEMTSFTAPVSIDKIVLWIRDPSSENTPTSLNGTATRVFKPFSGALWVVLIVVLVVFSIMSVWFANEAGGRSKWWQRLHGEEWDNGTLYYRTRTALRVFLDSFLANANDSCGGAVGFDINSSLSQKILNLGLGFLLLVTAAAYTANLATFLTLSSVGNYVSSIEEAIADNMALCVHPALQSDLTTAWPNANWVFSTVQGQEIITGDQAPNVLLNNFDSGSCQGVVAGLSDILDNAELANKFCDRGLVYTRSVVMHKPVAFPARKEIVAGLSHWMYEANQRGIDFTNFQKEARTPAQCVLSIDGHEVGISDEDHLIPLTPNNLALPLITLALCCLISALIHFHSTDGCQVKKKHAPALAASSDNGERKKSNNTLGTNRENHNFPSLASFNGTRLSIEDVPDSQTLFKTLQNLQNYQNDLVTLMIARQKVEKEN